MSDGLLEPAAISTDAFLGGHLRLRQPKIGHRSGTDAILLAAAAPKSIAGLALDVGSGAGAAGLALAALRSPLDLGLVESDPFAAALARENLQLNGFEGRVHEADVLSKESRLAAGLRDGMAELVITNPPFLDPAKSRPSPHQGKRAAHVMPGAGAEPLSAWISACMELLEERGLLLMIHRPEALPIMLNSLAPCAGDIALMPVYPRAGEPAVRILLRAKKNSRGPLKVARPFIVHEGEKFSLQAEAIHRGAALIEW